jgi:hypothetical protein
MKVETRHLTGLALDWAVGYARCLEATEGKPVLARDLMDAAIRNGISSPSTDWSQGGPIIEQEGIELLCNLTATEASRFKDAHVDWQAFYRQRRATEHRSFATTPLVAAMRCLVASKLGPEVEVPDELMAQAQAQRQGSRPRQVSSLSGMDLDRVVAGFGLPTSTCGADSQQIAVDDLDGRAMDFAMAVALGKRFDAGQSQPVWVHPGEAGKADSYSISIPAYTSADMADFVGGLALKEGIELKRLAQDLWQARLDLDEGDALVEDRAAPNAQLAVLRCFVASRLGTHVAVAREYLQEPPEQSGRQRERGG